MLIALYAFPARADESSTTSTATATVIAPLTVRAIEDLNFGTIAVALPQSGTVTISSSAGSPASYSGGARSACLPTAAKSNGCTTHPARFWISGEMHRWYFVAILDWVKARGRRAASAPLEVTALTVRSANRSDDDTGGLLDANGRDIFTVGGTLIVQNGAAQDEYRADIPVIVTYR